MVAELQKRSDKRSMLRGTASPETLGEHVAVLDKMAASGLSAASG